jgi:putative Mg2+ transporter-C (MgtC) family protein
MDLPTLSTVELLLRVVLAGALGGLVGLEREFSDQPAGFRTHILVSLGAALFTIVGAYGVHVFFVNGQQGVSFDPTRIAAQIVTGIGFLGAGAIIREGMSVRGLTTAAALWVTAAIGTAVGFGYWQGALAVALATVIALYGLKRMERIVLPRLKRGHARFRITLGPELRLSELAEHVEGLGARVHSMKIVTDDDGTRHLATYLLLPTGLKPNQVSEDLLAITGVTAVDWTT